MPFVKLASRAVAQAVLQAPTVWGMTPFAPLLIMRTAASVMKLLMTVNQDVEVMQIVTTSTLCVGQTTQGDLTNVDATHTQIVR